MTEDENMHSQDQGDLDQCADAWHKNEIIDESIAELNEMKKKINETVESLEYVRQHIRVSTLEGDWSGSSREKYCEYVSNVENDINKRKEALTKAIQVIDDAIRKLNGLRPDIFAIASDIVNGIIKFR